MTTTNTARTMATIAAAGNTGSDWTAFVAGLSGRDEITVGGEEGGGGRGVVVN